MVALEGKLNQLTNIKSNESEFVTKLRWVVETVDGITEHKFRLLNNVIDNKLLPKVKLYFKIAEFSHNHFSKKMLSGEYFLLKKSHILKRLIQ